MKKRLLKAGRKCFETMELMSFDAEYTSFMEILKHFARIFRLGLTGLVFSILCKMTLFKIDERMEQ